MGIPLLIIAGPTGIGKTRVAIEIAEQINGEIVGADSMQIYRYMDIGTAKPTPEERARVPHHLIDIRNPDEEFSAADYAREATVVIRDIHARGKVPLVVGGTGLYIQTLVYGIFEGPGRDEDFRQRMRTLAQEQGNAVVYQKLQEIDPKTAERLHPNDLLRIIRALEVFHLTGTPISAQQAAATAPLEEYSPCFLVLATDREYLYTRINDRVEAMIADGLVEEVRALLERGYHAELNPMKSLGYKEIAEFLAGEYDLPTAIEYIKRNTRRYAKRQLTWFRKYEAVNWIFRKPDAPVEPVVEQCLQMIPHQWMIR